MRSGDHTCVRHIDSNRSMALFCVFACILVVSVSCAMPNKHDRGEQRTVLKFLVKSGLSPTQCWRWIQEVHGNNSISKSTVALWHHRFSAGEVATTDRKRTGCPRTAHTPTKIDAVSNHINTNQSQTVWEIAQDLGMSNTSMHSIMKKQPFQTDTQVHSQGSDSRAKACPPHFL